MVSPPVFAHRGASFYAPENTLSAFRKAHQLGIKWVEFDVLLTKDHEIVVFHDHVLNRTTNSQGHVEHCLYSEIAQLDAGSWFNPLFVGEKVPLLRDVIVFLKENQMRANIEIKMVPGREVVMVECLLKEIEKHWSKEMGEPLFSSFSFTVLQELRQRNKNCLIGFLMDNWFDDWRQRCEELNSVSVHVNHTLLTPARVAEVKKTNRFLFTYTVNERERAQELYAWGVDAVYSDRPDQMVDVGL